MLDIEKYIEQLMCIATNNDLHHNAENMQRYISGPNTLSSVLCMLQDELDRGFITIYPEVMEARVCFEKYGIK